MRIEEKAELDNLAELINIIANDTSTLLLEYLNAAHKLNEIEERLRCARAALYHFIDKGVETENEGETGNE